MIKSKLNTRKKPVSLFLTAAGLTLLSGSTLAQPSESKATKVVTKRAALEEVVVTARRREESMQEAPVAVSAMSGDAMRQRGIANTSELTKSVPSLEISQGRASQIYIRGVGQRSGFARVDPTVGVYLDDLFIPRSDSQLLDTVDIENVQVLRGPQGTLFGKNTTGGAMVLTLAKPGDTQEGYVDVTLGSLGAQTVRAAWTQPISDDLSMRVAVNNRRRDGFTEDVVSGQKGGSVDRIAALLQTRWDASDSISVNTLLFLSDRDDTLEHNNCRINNQQALFLEGLYLAWPGDTDPAQPTAYRENCESNSRERLGDLKSNTGPHPNLNWDQQQALFGTTVEWLYSDDHQLKGVLGARKAEKGELVTSDQDGGPGNWSESHNHGTSEQKSFSAELQFSGGFADDRLRYTGGLFYMLEENFEPFTLVSGFGGLDSQTIAELGAGQEPTRPTSTGGVVSIPGIGGVAPGTPFVGAVTGNPIQQNEFDLKNTTLAAYVQTSYDLTEDLELTLGIRWTSEKRESNLILTQADTTAIENRMRAAGLVGACLGPALPAVCQSNVPWAADPVGLVAALFPDLNGDGIDDFPMNTTPFKDESKEKTFSKVTPMASLSYTIPGLGDGFLSSATLYATYSDGFKSGFFEPRVQDGLQQVEPEEVKNFELGYKLEALERSLRINGAIYTMEFTNQQLIQVQTDSAGNLAVVFDNAGNSDIKGTELEIQWMPSANMLVNFSASYNDYSFTEFSDRDLLQASLGNTVVVDRTDEPFPVSPEETYSVGVQYTWETSVGAFTPRIDASYKSEIYLGLDRGSFEAYERDKELAGDPAKTLVDLRFSWSSLDYRTSVAAFVKNATDERYQPGAASVGSSLGTFFSFYGEPRTYGLELRYEY
ncbi:outer membrane receptor protein involved in Fe transport [Litorivivens lipolytica]|uniref:Outer membrane receptor protein involved in Fe transport n=1 Tax=Litorivivens lipolytica TaxID=1524264 RepID=A0A7W4Z459_9GAMM|nr:TonB-dependent receptor [Litorivivens lipolytica]MBB3046189.1 outer membrane receptor protein involved in Fe transport [Litorivivens lipolytica]